MANVRSRITVSESLTAGEPYLRSPTVITEIVQGGLPYLRVRVAVIEAATGGVPNLRQRVNIVEALTGGIPKLRARILIVESLLEVREEIMSNAVFPAMIGLAWDVQKKPIFSNKIDLHTSGKETATSYYENPKWEYTLTYDYLPDVPTEVGDTDLHTLLGFFLNRRGRFDTFLFNDPDDNAVVEGFQKDFDGVTVDFQLVRSIGGFYEPVGQWNDDDPLVVWLNVTESSVIPDSPGPYTVTVTHAAAYVETESVLINGVAATQVPSAPAVGQYSVAAGVYTFNAANNEDDVDIRYRYLVDAADYTFSYPSTVEFDTAPPDGATAYSSFSYYFRVRFIEDSSEYTKFAKQLWELQELGFRSIPL